jgi:hypothetical protein
MRTIGLIAFTLCMGGVSPRAVPVETPIATAYSDGFEVIVCEPDAAAGRAKVRRLPLKQAEAKNSERGVRPDQRRSEAIGKRFAFESRQPQQCYRVAMGFWRR